MIEVEFNKVEIDYCPDCGIWLDAGELEQLVRSEEKLERWDPADSEEKPIICPRCGSRLEPCRPPKSALVLDRCPHGDGTWFDRGELEAVLDRLAGEGRALEGLRSVRELLRSIFPAQT